jgi:hypothetical protein
MRGLVTVTVLVGIMVLIVIMRVVVVVMRRHLPLTGFVDPEKDDYVGITIQTTYFPGMFRVKRYCRCILVPAPLSMGMRHLAEAVIS